VTLCQMQGEERLLVLSRLSPAFTPETVQKLGLSKSEAMVVPWLIRGRRNEEIGLILGISSRTAEKHIAGILVKLGVETRTAAVWNIIERSGAHR
jgi:DNA-binding CsgD family transcriptional regulator